MRAIGLVEILVDGSVPDASLDLAGIPGDVRPATVALYAERGFVRPWIAYLALDGGRIVGTCAFAAPPREGRVEIAYYTFAGHEGRGVATAMAERLVALARAADPTLTIYAQTLPKPGASTRILARLGFVCVGIVEHPDDGPVWEWHLGPHPTPGA